jgi:hypothetical protein
VLAGTVLSDDGIPVDRAMVSIVGTDKPGVRAIETNAAGEFTIDGPPAGSFTVWWQGRTLVSTIDVFLAGESVPRHYVETLSISPEGILAVRIERVGFPDTRTLSYKRAR